MQMKRFLLAFLLGNALLKGAAQSTPLQKYEIAPADFEHVFLDMVARNPCSLTTTESGQYVGQTNDDKQVYGYGTFVNNDGSQRTGQYRNGRFIFGITINNDNAIVGGNDFYATYSLTTGRLEYIFKANEKQLIDGQGLYDYAFVSMNYNNGDRYVGEIYKGKRHGYGIYYYANGDYWYGQYRDDVRYGFGALFTAANQLFIGQWNIEDTPRLITVKSK